MSIANWLAYVLLGMGGIGIIYSFFLVYKWMRAGSLLNTPKDNASQQDIIDLRSNLSANFVLLITEVRGLRQDVKNGACKYAEPKSGNTTQKPKEDV